MQINKITSRKILASLGDETVEANVELEDGKTATASIPAGISAGKYEIKKVTADEAIEQINQICQICAGKDWSQESLDKEISSHDFGGNATLAVSAAFFKATNPGLIEANRLPLDAKCFPRLMLLCFEGGKHGNDNLSIQEFMIIEDSIIEAGRDFRTLREYMNDNFIEKTVGAEGGFSPLAFSNEDALNTLKKVFPDKKIALDVADTFAAGEKLDLDDLVANYNLASIEDPFDDENWTNWTNLTNSIGQNILVIGDDLTTTNSERIKKAIDLKAVNAVVIKPNQIGTITAAMDASKLAHDNSLKVVVSHRGEETDDDWIVDFALAVQADFVKLGGMDRGERIAKYNRLMELGMK